MFFSDGCGHRQRSEGSCPKVMNIRKLVPPAVHEVRSNMFVARVGRAHQELRTYSEANIFIAKSQKLFFGLFSVFLFIFIFVFVGFLFV